MTEYAFPMGGHPDQTGDPSRHGAVFTESYAYIPASAMRDIVTSFFPNWSAHHAWILARPLSGFAETFAQYAMHLAPGGGSNDPEPDRNAEGVIFVADGTAQMTIGAEAFHLRPGSFAYIPPAVPWTMWNTDEYAPCRFHWIRKRFQHMDNLRVPDAVVLHEADVPAAPMPDSNGNWATQRFLEPLDLRYDMHVNIVNFQPGGRIPFPETHVMEHGLYVLQGTGDYLVNRDWISVGPGDFIWMRAFCPQACIATGDEPFRYLLYKDVNRHPGLAL